MWILTNYFRQSSYFLGIELSKLTILVMINIEIIDYIFLENSLLNF